MNKSKDSKVHKLSEAQFNLLNYLFLILLLYLMSWIISPVPMNFLRQGARVASESFVFAGWGGAFCLVAEFW